MTGSKPMFASLKTFATIAALGFAAAGPVPAATPEPVAQQMILADHLVPGTRGDVIHVRFVPGTDEAAPAAQLWL
jgi:hypothetical protein